MLRQFAVITCVSAAVLRFAAGVDCGVPTGLRVETADAFYNYEYVGDASGGVGCLSTWIEKNAYPFASTPPVNSIFTVSNPYVLTLATNTATKECGLRKLTSDGTASWNVTFEPYWQFLCQGDPTQPSPLLAIQVTKTNHLHLVISQGVATQVAYLHWNGTTASNVTLQNCVAGTPITASTDGTNLIVAMDSGVLLFWTSIHGSGVTPAYLSNGYGIMNLVQDVKLSETIFLFSLPPVPPQDFGAYVLGCSSPINPVVPNYAPLPVVGNSTVYANRNAYDGQSHNWWQFVDNGAVMQFAIWVNCDDTPTHQYALPANTTLPWSSTDTINVLALPL